MCVPAKQSARLSRVTAPSTSERFMIVNPPLRKKFRGMFSSGTAGVRTTSVESGSRNFLRNCILAIVETYSNAFRGQFSGKGRRSAVVAATFFPRERK